MLVPTASNPGTVEEKPVHVYLADWGPSPSSRASVTCARGDARQRREPSTTREPKYDACAQYDAGSGRGVGGNGRRMVEEARSDGGGGGGGGGGGEPE